MVNNNSIHKLIGAKTRIMASSDRVSLSALGCIANINMFVEAY